MRAAIKAGSSCTGVVTGSFRAGSAEKSLERIRPQRQRRYWTAVLSTLHRLTGGALPLIGAGGVASAEDAFARIRAGASAVQLYTAMIFEGVSLGARIARGLDRLLEQAGAANVAELVGADVPVRAEV